MNIIVLKVEGKIGKFNYFKSDVFLKVMGFIFKK